MTPHPLQKLLTDITEFKCLNDEKLYLSPIMDLYNQEIIAWEVFNRPTLDIAIEPLKAAPSVIKNNATYRTTLHSDQGWHYQHHKWVKTLKQHGIFRNMSRKGTCLGNSLMENFFGILKQKMYYGEKILPYAELKQEVRMFFWTFSNN